jgi:hypothetical protein
MLVGAEVGGESRGAEGMKGIFWAPGKRGSEG